MKGINLIFAEHSKLKAENTLLWKEIDIYKGKESLYQQTDSLNKKALDSYQRKVTALNNNVANLNKQLKKQKTATAIWRTGGLTVSFGFLLWALLK